MNPAEKKSGRVSLRSTLAFAAVAGVVVAAWAYRVAPGFDAPVGAFLGLLLALLNYAFLTAVVAKMIGGTGSKLGWGALLFLKMLALVAVAAAAFWWLQVSPVAFAAGYGALIAVLIVQHLAVSLGFLA